MASQLIISKDDLIFIQKRGYLRSISEVERAWHHFENRCIHYPTNAAQTTSGSFIDIPPLKGGLKSKDSTHDNDVIIAFSKHNGVSQAKLIKQALIERGLKAAFAQEETETDLNSAEFRIANSSTLVVILTSDCLKQLEVAFSMSAGQYYYKSVSQVHDAGSCLFPGYDEQPPSLSNLFSEKAITFLSCYADIGIDQIEQKVRKEISQKNAAANETQAQAFQHLMAMYEGTDRISIVNIQDYLKIPKEEMDAMVKEIDQNHDGFVTMEEFSRMFSKSEKFAKLFGEEVHEDITTRIFLSHKRSSGQAIAGRLYENLKEHYSIFLDSEAKFQIHNLKQIVENTGHFIFILSHGIFLSKWCLEELKSAVANNKPVSIVRDLSFTLPATIPPEWAEFEHLFRSPDQLVWIAEYNKACVDGLIKQIGASDHQLAGASILTSAKRMEGMKSSGVLKVPAHLTNCLGATCIQLQKIGGLGFIRTLDCRGYGITNEDMALLQRYQIKFPNLEILQIQEQRNLQAWFKWIAASQCDLKIIECGFHSVSVTDADLQLIASHFRNLREISLNHVDCSKASLLAFFHKVPNLRKLALRYPEAKFDSEFMEELSQCCPDLESLEIRHPEFVGRPFQKARFPNLTNFFFEGIDSWEAEPDLAYEDVARACPGLTAFYFDVWTPSQDTITGAGLQAIGTGCRNLESLVCLADEKYLKVLPESFPKLKNLEIRMAPTEDAIKYVAEISTLEELSIVGSNLTDSSLEVLAPIFPKLKKMKLMDFMKVTDEGFGRLLSHSKSVENLVVSGSRVTPSIVLANLPKTLKDVELVSFGGNEFKLAATDFATLLSFPNLKRVLATVATGSDQMVPSIIPLLSLLEELSLGSCTEITKKGMTQLIANIPKTQALEIRNLKFKEFDATLLPGMQPAQLSRQVNMQYQKKNPDCNIIMTLSN